MKHKDTRHRVGEMRPSQLIFSAGVGAVIDLPRLSVMVMGLDDDWNTGMAAEIGEERLKRAVQDVLGSSVRRLLTPPLTFDSGGGAASAESALIGVPVAVFPGWFVCPYCRVLAPADSPIFQIKVNKYYPDRTRYEHINCRKLGSKPKVMPARFLVACKHGHLDDFPWHYYLHRGTECEARLVLKDRGISGEAADILVECESCGKRLTMAMAFGKEALENMPTCQGRRPHLRDYEDECDQQMRTILLGASNSWFPLNISVLSVPMSFDKLAQLLDKNWHILEDVENEQNVRLLRRSNLLREFADYTDEMVWKAIERRQKGENAAPLSPNLKVPEWQVFSAPNAAPTDRDFRATEATAPLGYEDIFTKVVLMERLREVRAMVGFTRVEPPDDLDTVDAAAMLEHRAPLSRKSPTWAPATEVHGEGIFLQFSEGYLNSWLERAEVCNYSTAFFTAHKEWRRARHLEPFEEGYPGMRFVLLHSFSHMLMRQLALESGYSAASIRERIYSLSPKADDGPMAGVLLYTAAADSEGTLGGLVNMGDPTRLGDHIRQALEQMRLCSSDPLCAEHTLPNGSAMLHGAACHACLFAPETSCERGNKYLDRTVLVETIQRDNLAFFKEV